MRVSTISNYEKQVITLRNKQLLIRAKNLISRLDLEKQALAKELDLLKVRMKNTNARPKLNVDKLILSLEVKPYPKSYKLPVAKSDAETQTTSTNVSCPQTPKDETPHRIKWKKVSMIRKSPSVKQRTTPEQSPFEIIKEEAGSQMLEA